MSMPEPAPTPTSLEELTHIALARDGQSLVDLYVGLRGRIGRRVFWLQGVLALLLVAMIGNALMDIAGVEADMAGKLVNLVLAWPVIAVSAKRWHDCNKSGWWVLINMIPAIGWLAGLVANGFWPGTPGPNRYGPDPLTRTRTAPPA